MEAWLANPSLLSADADAEYADVIEVDLDQIKEPLVAAPNDPDNIKTLSECAGDPVQEVFIGSCMTNIGHYRAAAKVLEGEGAVKVRLWIAPPPVWMSSSCAKRATTVFLLLLGHAWRCRAAPCAWATKPALLITPRFSPPPHGTLITAWAKGHGSIWDPQS